MAGEMFPNPPPCPPISPYLVLPDDLVQCKQTFTERELMAPPAEQKQTLQCSNAFLSEQTAPLQTVEMTALL